MSIAPLDDPAYGPQHPPVDGAVPEVVAKWGAASQLRWFTRFRDELKRQPSAVWSQFFVSSVQHKGGCCVSCEEDHEYFEDACCCRGTGV